MKTITINLYEFKELSDDAKAYAIRENADVNVDSQWWDDIYSDAENVGIKITSFDVDRNEIGGELTESAIDASDLIIANHGEQCDTFKLAMAYRVARETIFKKHEDKDRRGNVSCDKYDEFDSETDVLDEQFTNDLLKCYLTLLRTFYDTLTSEKEIIETIVANEYYFTECGELHPD